MLIEQIRKKAEGRAPKMQRRTCPHLFVLAVALGCAPSSTGSRWEAPPRGAAGVATVTPRSIAPAPVDAGRRHAYTAHHDPPALDVAWDSSTRGVAEVVLDVARALRSRTAAVHALHVTPNRTIAYAIGGPTDGDHDMASRNALLELSFPRKALWRLHEASEQGPYADGERVYTDMVVSPDGKRMVTASFKQVANGPGRGLHLWTLTGRRKDKPLDTSGLGRDSDNGFPMFSACAAAAFSRDSQKLVTSNAAGTVLWDLAKGTRHKLLSFQEVTRVGFADEEKAIVVAVEQDHGARTLVGVSIAEGKPLFAIPLERSHRAKPASGAADDPKPNGDVCAGGRFFVWTGKNESLLIVDVSERTVIGSLPLGSSDAERRLAAVACSPSTMMLAAVHTDGTLDLVDLSTLPTRPNERKPVSVARLSGPGPSASTLAFSPDGTSLFSSATDGEIRWWRWSR
jgi:WD40 repeat protein